MRLPVFTGHQSDVPSAPDGWRYIGYRAVTKIDNSQIGAAAPNVLSPSLFTVPGDERWLVERIAASIDTAVGSLAACSIFANYGGGQPGTADLAGLLSVVPLTGMSWPIRAAGGVQIQAEPLLLDPGTTLSFSFSTTDNSNIYPGIVAAHLMGRLHFTVWKET